MNDDLLSAEHHRTEVDVDATPQPDEPEAGPPAAVAPSRWRRTLRRTALSVGALVVTGAVALWTFGAGWAESRALATLEPGPYTVDADDLALYDSAHKVDLHADALLWRRDLTKRHARGHVDLPRLHEADVAVQVFGLVTQVPLGKNYDSNPDSDVLGALAFVNHWPTRTWRSVPQRAMHQARQLHETAERSEGRLVVVRTSDDLADVLRRRDRGEQVVAGLLGLEGLQVLEGQVAMVDRMFDAGVRMGGLAHFFDNEVAGSSSGRDKLGLTDVGRQVVARMEQLGMIVDLAHASPAAVHDVLEIATRPVVVSHTGVAATCPGNRNLTDDQLRGIAATGGVVGIGYWEGAVCGTSPQHIARAIAHAVGVAGAEHVALGSDFDGAVTTAFDVTGLPLLVPAMRDEGLTDRQIALVLGDNAIRVLLETLPAA